MTRSAPATLSARAAPSPAAAPSGGGSKAAVEVTRPPAELERISVAYRASSVSSEALVSLSTLEELREVALGCPRCRLCETRSHVVFGEGSGNADLMVVGEAPGAEEDRTGRPFVGRAGKLLDLLLSTVGFSRESIYICNVLKCRPPGNRNPAPEEIEACSPYLRRQVQLVKPRAILAVGGFAAQTLLGSTTPIGRLRGTVHDFEGVPLVPSYHPAALLRNPVWVRPVWEDLQRLRAILDDR
ncbi:MAG: uracil-DNA glycosylase [Gemmatimonadetes bacterium]|nr:uracil-DNA glycosylase [Gemmatimonadota bacterium]